MADTDVVIIDSGGANIASLQFALERLGANSRFTSDADTINAASHVILPGVGAAANAMQRLRAIGLDALIPRLRQPVLGICLGMQLLAQASDEDHADCLNVVPSVARQMTGSPRHPVPHMGWAPIRIVREHHLFEGVADGSYFYFVHSYALPVAGSTLATADHGAAMTAILARDNFVATQFHPEKSAAAGARLLKNFLAM